MNKFIILVLLIWLPASFADVYKWTDSQGIVHFSDKPHSGAEQIKIPEAQTYSAPAPVADDSSTKDTDKKQQDHKYTKLVITQPQNEATIRNDQGLVIVNVQVEPDLSEGDMLQMVFDGAAIGDPQAQTLFQLTGIYRGSHTLSVQLVDSNGNVLLTSDNITIFMHRPRVGMGNAGHGGGP